MILCATVGKDIGCLEGLLKGEEAAFYRLMQIMFDYGALCGKNKIGVPELVAKDTSSDPIKKNVITG